MLPGSDTVGRKPPQLNGKQQNQHHAQPETRNSGQKQRNGCGKAVNKRILLDRGYNTNGDAHQRRTDDTEKCKRDCSGQSGDDFFENRPLGIAGLAKITSQRINYIINKPDEKGAVKAQLFIELRNFFRCGLRSKYHFRRCTGGHGHNGKYDKHDAENDGNQQQQPFDNISSHKLTSHFLLRKGRFNALFRGWRVLTPKTCRIRSGGSPD